MSRAQEADVRSSYSFLSAGPHAEQHDHRGDHHDRHDDDDSNCSCAHVNLQQPSQLISCATKVATDQISPNRSVAYLQLFRIFDVTVAARCRSRMLLGVAAVGVDTRRNKRFSPHDSMVHVADVGTPTALVDGDNRPALTRARAVDSVVHTF